MKHAWETWCGAPRKDHPCLPCPLGFEKQLFRPLALAVLSHGSFAAQLLLVSSLPSARREVSDSANGLGGSVRFLLPRLGRLPRLPLPAARWGLRRARLYTRLACATPRGRRAKFRSVGSSAQWERARGCDTLSCIREKKKKKIKK